MKKVLFLTFLIISLSSLDLVTPKENIQASVIFCPSNDCQKAFINHFSNAEKSIHCAFYDLKDNTLLDTLSQKSKETEVKLVLDNQVEFSSKNIVKDSKETQMHNKFCVIDKEITLTGSTNPTHNGFFKNNNNILIIHSKKVANNFEQEFQELYEGTFSGGQKTKAPLILSDNFTIKTFFCPEDKCEEQVLKELQNATDIKYMLFTITSSKIANALKEKNAQGIVEKTQISRYSKAHDINATIDNNPNNMHHKVFIIDNETVITGSYNPTGNGNKYNDENVVILKNQNIAKQYLEEFNHIQFHSN